MGEDHQVGARLRRVRSRRDREALRRRLSSTASGQRTRRSRAPTKTQRGRQRGQHAVL